MPPFYRRYLSHWRHDASPAVHFVTWRLATGQPGLAPAERDLLCSVVQRGRGERFELLAFVVMDDHVHVLVQPTRASLERLVHSWKSFSAHQLQRLHRRLGPVWQHESFDQVIRTDEELRQKTEYIIGNPWKRWPFVKGYTWVWEAADVAATHRHGTG